ncbi:sulfotransferase family protein [Algisphaera agarilytica]|uniref:Sulfotransferase family protein n=1 Tax=Algisphaera agarilytica TaxID=1385975 RepID=A0A7X0H604_9BACT|nr:sulfotransferase [Algisphaera agarilytica]MBB6429938.1 hypothetical protein [Algisphaera agarilytica]
MNAAPPDPAAPTNPESAAAPVADDSQRDRVLNEPVFIVGPLRSGTTLLRLLIDHHPQAYIFGEFEGCVSEAVGDNWPDIASYHEFAKTDRMMLLNGFEVDPSLDYPALMHSFIAQAYDRGGQLPVLGGTIHSRMDLLPKLWPNAKFIHTLRDPRDVARSCIGMGWASNVHGGADYWIRPEEHWDKLCSQVKPEQTLDVKYEDLVREPEAELTRVCEFLGLTYDPAMLALDVDTTYSRPDPKLAEQWRTKQSPRERQLVEYQCLDLMKARGYELSDGEPTPPGAFEKLRLNLGNRWGRVTFNSKRWGVSNWLQYAVAQRTGPKSWEAAVRKRIDEIQNSHMR